MNVKLKMFCILCLVLSCLVILCIILCGDTSKASENLAFALKQCLILSSVFVVIIICCLGAMKIKDSVEQITLDLFQNCDVPEEVSVTFDPEVDLSDDAVGRSRYERIYSVHSRYARENLVYEDVRESPVEWGDFDGTFPCKLETTNLPKFIM